MILYVEHLWDSPYVFTAFVALREKEVPFEIRELDLAAGESRRPDYAAQSLTARVPAIDHEGFVLSESTAIVEYLEEVFPAPQWPRILPESARERARARQIMAWLRSDLMPLREERSTETMFFERATNPLGSRARAAADKLVSVAERVVRNGATSLFDAWCIADADLAFMLHRLLLNGDEMPDTVRRYAEAQWTRPSVQEFVTHARPRLRR
jgi:glutathione S-transferase